MTRSTTRHFRQHGIHRELIIRLERNIQADVVSHLQNQPPQQSITHRRASVSSTSLFSIGGIVREAGFVRFARIPRPSCVAIGSASDTSGLTRQNQAALVIPTVSTIATVSLTIEPIEVVDEDENWNLQKFFEEER